MPGVVARYRADAPYGELRREQESILQRQVDDFVQYAGHADLLTARSVFRSLPIMVGRRTKYSEIADEVSPYRASRFHGPMSPATASLASGEPNGSNPS